ncbi:hypothetical protein MSG28_002508 [Choristoneura fumiferana]|uniref:Uncharacterized protein n=1 Tax=Choristoneura fumiferana TaxID=7141 RepID=A0ACC0JVT8_CHOFU|nr:hypothetical protein MSG28_002508 [Choristoneura fumiferana]
MEFSCVGRYMSHVAAHGPVRYRCGCGAAFPTRLDFTAHQRATKHEGQTVEPGDGDAEVAVSVTTKLLLGFTTLLNTRDRLWSEMTAAVSVLPLRLDVTALNTTDRLEPGDGDAEVAVSVTTVPGLYHAVKYSGQTLERDDSSEPEPELAAVDKLVSNVQDTALPAAMPDADATPDDKGGEKENLHRRQAKCRHRSRKLRPS